jgi:2-polyprenyl-3-methyl-5-hydroxy-6-metoxy-1,4-benzoquinol methylase
MGFIKFITENTPWPIRRISRRLKHRLSHDRSKSRTPREVFTQIYVENHWDDGSQRTEEDYPFCSGPGSAEAAAVPYADCVNNFIRQHGVKRVVDLGCGDFRVGRRIALESIHYVGVDIVEPVINVNRARFSSDHIDFRCIDVIAEDIPDGDLCLVREVLQHLSNSQILAILAKLKKFKWVIVTESQPGPPGSFTPNRDKPHGGDSRALWKSGVVLSEPPFSLPHVELLLTVPAAAPADNYRSSGRIDTFLIRN